MVRYFDQKQNLQEPWQTWCNGSSCRQCFDSKCLGVPSWCPVCPIQKVWDSCSIQQTRHLSNIVEIVPNKTSYNKSFETNIPSISAHHWAYNYQHRMAYWNSKKHLRDTKSVQDPLSSLRFAPVKVEGKRKLMHSLGSIAFLSQIEFIAWHFKILHIDWKTSLRSQDAPVTHLQVDVRIDNPVVTRMIGRLEGFWRPFCKTQEQLASNVVWDW